jgi:hypothetical protein
MSPTQTFTHPLRPYVRDVDGDLGEKAPPRSLPILFLADKDFSFHRSLIYFQLMCLNSPRICNSEIEYSSSIQWLSLNGQEHSRMPPAHLCFFLRDNKPLVLKSRSFPISLAHLPIEIVPETVMSAEKCRGRNLGLLT